MVWIMKPTLLALRLKIFIGTYTREGRLGQALMMFENGLMNKSLIQGIKCWVRKKWQHVFNHMPKMTGVVKCAKEKLSKCHPSVCGSTSQLLQTT